MKEVSEVMEGVDKQIGTLESTDTDQEKWEATRGQLLEGLSQRAISRNVMIMIEMTTVSFALRIHPNGDMDLGAGGKTEQEDWIWQNFEKTREAIDQRHYKGQGTLGNLLQSVLVGNARITVTRG